MIHLLFILSIVYCIKVYFQNEVCEFRIKELDGKFFIQKKNFLFNYWEDRSVHINNIITHRLIAVLFYNYRYDEFKINNIEDAKDVLENHYKAITKGSRIKYYKVNLTEEIESLYSDIH